MTLSRCLLLSLSLFASSAFSSEGLSHYENALKAFQAGEFETAYIHIRNSLKEKPGYLPAKILLGRVFLQNGVNEAAETEFFEALQAGADPDLVTVFWGRSLLNQQKYREIVSYSDLQDLSQENQGNWFQIKASACQLSGDTACAIQTYQLLIDRPDMVVEGLLGLAMLHLNSGEVSAAQPLLQDAMTRAPDSAEVWRLQGLLHKAQGNLDESISHLKQALVLAPDDPATARNLADVFLAAHDFDSAQVLVSEILSNTPNDPYVLLISGWLEKDASALTRDLEKVDQILADIPQEGYSSQPNLYYLLGLSRYLQGNFEQAKEAFGAFLLQRPGDFQAAMLQAKTYVALDNVRGAVKLLEPHRTRLLDDVKDAILLGELYIRLAQNYKAYSWITEVKNQFPAHIGVQLLLAKLAISRGKVEEGLSDLESLLNSHPDSLSILKTHATVCMQIRRLEAAASSVSTLSKLAPQDPFVKNLQAALLVMQGKVQQAQAILTDVLASNPELFAARFNQAMLWSKQGQLNKASAMLEQLISEEPEHIPSILLLAEIQLAIGSLDVAQASIEKVLGITPDQVKARELEAEILLRKNAFSAAEFKLNTLSLEYPDNLKYKLDLARVLVGEERNQKAIAALRELFVLAQDDAAILIAINRLQLILKDNAAALDSIKRAHDVIPLHLATHIRYVKGLISNEKFDKAEAQLNALSERHDGNLQVLFSRAELAEARGQLNEAHTLYTQVLAQDDRFDLALAKLFALGARGIGHPQYLKINEQVVRNHPNAYFPRSLLAQDAYYRGQNDTAIIHYEYLKDHTEVPDQAALLNRLALLHMPKDLAKSENYAEKAYSLDAGKSTVVDTYGWVLAKTGQFEVSLPLLRRAHSLNSRSPLIHYHLAYVLAQLGKKDEAISLLENALAEHASFYDRDKAETLLRSLQ